MSSEHTQRADRKILEIEGRTIVFDHEGFFNDPDDWSPAVARVLAGKVGLDSLKDRHWRVLHFLRDYYYQNGRAPLNKPLKEGLQMNLREIEGLFPGGIKYGARRIAGLPNPKSCM